MPQRTNDFQKLVKIINSRLAPSGAKITESAMLYDSEAETDREVDILVEVEYLNCPIKIGIECTAIKHPLDTKIIEGFKEKHRKLGIHQTIVVSRHGFYAPAKKYAAKNHIRLLTLSAARKERWSTIYEHLKGLSMYGRTYFLKSLSLKIDAEKADANFNMNASTHVLTEDGEVLAYEYALNIFKLSDVSRRIFKELKENEESASDPWVEIGFNLGGGIEFRDQDGRSVWPQEMTAFFGYRSKYRNLDVDEVSYDGKSLVAGGFFDKKSGENAHIAIEEVAGELVGTFEVSEAMFPSGFPK